MTRRPLPAVLFFSLFAASLRAESPPPEVKPPLARKVPHVTKAHGETRTDDYFWLRDRDGPEVLAHLKAENAYAEAMTRHLKAFQQRLYKEVLARTQQTDSSVPYRDRGFYYYTRTQEGKEYPALCRKKGSLDAPEEVLLDGNALARGHPFFDVGDAEVSDDGRLLAYATDTTGSREYRLWVKDLRSGKHLEAGTRKVTTLAWSADNRTLFYVAEDRARRPCRLYRHRAGSDTDDLVYEEKDERFRLSVRRSRDRKLLFAVSRSFSSTEARYLPADRPDAPLRVVLPRAHGHEYDVDHRDGLFYLRTNSRGAKNFKLVSAPVGRPARWKEVVPHHPAVLIERFWLFRDFAVLLEREGGLPRLAVRDLATGASHSVRMPEPVYSVFADANPEFDSPSFRFRYESFTTPPSVFEYHPKGRTRKLLKRKKVLGGYDPSKYTCERVLATARDGTKVPISLAYRKDVRRDGKAPLWLRGYGAYGAAVPATFSLQDVSLLDRGVVLAWAHVRGGGDLGPAWHEGGRLLRKKNSFTDFVDCADHLVARKYTSRDRLAVQGGSAGGLLIGAALNLRPDLCRVAVLNVPFVDVLNTMLDASLPLTVPEYLEWGDPNDKRTYEYMKSYCPYTNLKAARYPALLVTAALNDSQVMYWEPAKYVAKLRALKKDADPLLLRVNLAAGHGGASGRYESLRERAFVMAFVLDQVGIRK
jgi:oligopeptidase B